MSFMKSFSEKKQDATPAQRLGLIDHKVTVRELLGSRLFPTRIGLPGESGSATTTGWCRRGGSRTGGGTTLRYAY